MKVLAISGSLRAASSNAALLRDAAALAPTGMEFVPYQGLGALPHFNPDLDAEGAEPPAALAWRAEPLRHCAACGKVVARYPGPMPGDQKLSVSAQAARRGIQLKTGRGFIVQVSGLRGTPGQPPIADQSAPVEPEPAQPSAPRSLLATLEDVHFEYDKTFPLPTAIDICRDIGAQVRKEPPAHILVAGHADRHGDCAYNKGLSRVRAENIASMLHDTGADEDRWLAQYGSPQFGKKWGHREDQHMLSALPHVGPRFFAGPVGDAPTPESIEAARRFQRMHGLKDDGICGPITRRALVNDYLNATALDVPESIPLEVLGCGYFHPQGPTDADDRRVEVFLFEGELKPPASDCDQAPPVKPGELHCDAYDAWKKEVDGPVPHADHEVPVAGPSVLVGATTQILCQHGGVAAAPVSGRVLVSGSPAVAVTDALVISGCPLPSPCVSVMWTQPGARSLRDGAPLLLASNVGLTRDASGQVTGVALIVGPQMRVQGA